MNTNTIGIGGYFCAKKKKKEVCGEFLSVVARLEEVEVSETLYIYCPPLPLAARQLPAGQPPPANCRQPATAACRRLPSATAGSRWPPPLAGCWPWYIKCGRGKLT